MRKLNPEELSKFCNANDHNRGLCSTEKTWRMLLAHVFPDIYQIAQNMEFPDLEEKLRGAERKFMPMRELYTQLSIISLDEAHVGFITLILNDVSEIRLSLDRYKEDIRIYYQILSFFLSHISPKWKEYLVRKDDIIVRFVPFSVLEMYNLTYKYSKKEILQRYITDFRVDRSAADNYAIRVASQRGYIEIVKVLLADPDVDPSADSNYAIRLASQNGHTDIVKLLLGDERVNPADKNNEAIRLAAENGHTDIIELLSDHRRVTPV